MWTIDGIHYDLSQFIHLHPGGSDILLSSRGNEISGILRGYHLTQYSHLVKKLDLYRVDDVEPLPIDSTFHDELKDSVRKYAIHRSPTIRAGIGMPTWYWYWIIPTWFVFRSTRCICSIEM